MYYNYCQRKSVQECFQSLKHCFGHRSPPKATVLRSNGNDRRLENVSRVESLIKKDPKMAYAEIQDIMKISSGSLTRILHDCLGVRKRCARLVPHNLSEEQKTGRVDWCIHMQRKFDGGRSHSVWDIVTGDTTWVYQYDPETKQQSAEWVFPDENPSVKLNRNKSASKQMIACFFANFSHVTIPLEDRKTVTAD